MYRKQVFRFFIFLTPILFIFSQCFNFNDNKNSDPRGDKYAGSATCIKCHKNIADSYLHTAHYMASQPSTAHNIHGSFSKGFNEFSFNTKTKVLMEKRDSGFFQTSYYNGKKLESARFDITLGAIKGESYLYWKENELFQLPVSYDDNIHSWIKSPGYDTTSASFDRMIGKRCLECHSSYVKDEPPKVPIFFGTAEGFEKKSLIMSVDCERCHGPAADHVNFQTANPSEKKAKYIVTYRSLTREQKIDMCAVCHSGTNTVTFKTTFDFKPGDTLSKFKRAQFENAPLDYSHIDVHGNQKGMLASSKCFINSTMDCATCHNTHVNEREAFASFAQRCMNCHNGNDHNLCKMTNKLSAAVLKSNCINCHMPAQVSKVIVTSLTGNPVLVRTHHIAIYPQEVKKILSYVNTSQTISLRSSTK